MKALHAEALERAQGHTRRALKNLKAMGEKSCVGGSRWHEPWLLQRRALEARGAALGPTHPDTEEWERSVRMHGNNLERKAVRCTPHLWSEVPEFLRPERVEVAVSGSNGHLRHLQVLAARSPRPARRRCGAGPRRGQQSPRDALRDNV